MCHYHASLLQIVQTLLHKGADPDTEDELWGWKAIHHAAKNGSCSVVGWFAGPSLFIGADFGG